MQYAYINGVRSFPLKGKTGECICCGNEVIAKCGKINIHHWAHKRSKDCDPWSEPETEWHREWKNKFPEDYREVSFQNQETKEFHRADVHTKDGVTIEFQNSPLSVEEFNQRNGFYKKLIWVVNGSPFTTSFKFEGNIPNPDDPRLNNFEMREKVFFKKEDILQPRIQARPWLLDKTERLLRVYGLNCPELKGVEVSSNHYLFSWKNKRKLWFQSDAIIFLDFGDDFLHRLRKREQHIGVFWYIQKVKKIAFIKKYSE